MSMEWCREKAAQAWCKPATEHLTMIPELAEAFAQILNEIWEMPLLGNATTKELLNEIAARLTDGQLNYKTSNG